MMYRPKTRMKELLESNYKLLAVTSRFNIAFGFGDKSVEEVCEKNRVDTPTFLAVCNLLSGHEFDASAISLPSLIEYLRRAHSAFFEITFPHIRHHLIDAITCADADEAALLLLRFYDDYVDEVRRHMEHENREIFTYAERLLSGEWEGMMRISDYSGNHESMARKLDEIKNIFIYHYTQKDNARLSAALAEIIICEKDLESHFEVENNLFVPNVELLESRLSERTRSGGPGNYGAPINSTVCGESFLSSATTESGERERSRSQVELSEREKDIIRLVARGKANKEIADELFISAHTVATHRRNISSKLNIHSPAGLTIYALLNHIVELDTLNPM